MIFQRERVTLPIKIRMTLMTRFLASGGWARHCVAEDVTNLCGLSRKGGKMREDQERKAMEQLRDKYIGDTMIDATMTMVGVPIAAKLMANPGVIPPEFLTVFMPFYGCLWGGMVFKTGMSFQKFIVTDDFLVDELQR